MWLMGGMATGSEMNDVWYSEDGINWRELKSTTGNEPANTRHAQSTTVFDNALWYMCGIASNNAWKITNTATMSGVNSAGTETFRLKLSPNPALENVVVSFTSSNNKKNTIQLYNMLGSLVYEMEHTCINSICSASIDISEIPGGVYFVQVKNQPGLIAKFIKQ
jgi:hypothetical protein